MGHQYATAAYLPNLGEKQGIEEIAKNITREETEEVARLAGRQGIGMYDESDVREAFANYIETGEIQNSLVDTNDLVSAVYKAGLNNIGNLERFLYSEVDRLGKFRFHAEGQYKRIHRDRRGEVALLEGRDQKYDSEDQVELLRTIQDNYESLEAAENVEPVSREYPLLIQLDDNVVLKMEFYDRMLPVAELRDDQMEVISGLVDDASEEMQDMIANGNFVTTHPEDFNYGESDRAEEHFFVSEEDLDELEAIEELMISDMGETEPSFGNVDESDFIH